MRTHDCARWLAVLGWMCGASVACAQIPRGSRPPDQVVAMPKEDPQGDPHAIPPQYDLSGPRLGATFSPDGEVRSQFGWHFEHQIQSAEHGPSLLVENVLLVGGVEQHQFIPSWTLVFGVRSPDGFEFGVGPSFTLSSLGFGSGIVAAAGKTFRINGVQIPFNLAYAFDKNGQRLSVVTGWAVRPAPDYN